MLLLTYFDDFILERNTSKDTLAPNLFILVGKLYVKQCMDVFIYLFIANLFFITLFALLVCKRGEA